MDNHDDEICEGVKIEGFPIPAANRPKLSGFEFYEKVLGSPKYVVAPMVDASELAWRLLSRRHNAELCYTPMYHANCFVKDIKYRVLALQSCPEDRPLILQFCGNDPSVLLEAALIAQDHCDAIDINLGCPQQIAKRGHYGAFLQDEWELLAEIVKTLHENLQVPVTCKIRIFEDVNRTIAYAQMLEKAGAQILTVHGRTREQKGPLTGLADWSYIKTVRESVSVPVFANGNILSLEDVERCLENTKANGVMSAEGNLYNPALYSGKLPLSWEMAHEYLDLIEQYPAPRGFIRGHLFKIFHHLLNLKTNFEQREILAVNGTVEKFRSVVQYLEEKYKPYHEGTLKWEPETVPGDFNMKLPPWLCQPYFRASPEDHIQKLEELQNIAKDPNTIKRQFFDLEGNAISRKKAKKLKKTLRKPKAGEKLNRHEELCLQNDCLNTKGSKCAFYFCKTCCRNKCYADDLDCIGHQILIKSKRIHRLRLEAEKLVQNNQLAEC